MLTNWMLRIHFLYLGKVKGGPEIANNEQKVTVREEKYLVNVNSKCTTNS